jgi:hypothetical protein
VLKKDLSYFVPLEMGALPILGATKGVGQCFKLQFYTFEKLEAKYNL